MICYIEVPFKAGLTVHIIIIHFVNIMRYLISALQNDEAVTKKKRKQVKERDQSDQRK